MTPKWQKLASLAQSICTLWFQFFGAVFASKGYPFKNIFDFTTAGDWDCVAAVERLPGWGMKPPTPNPQPLTEILSTQNTCLSKLIGKKMFTVLRNFFFA